MTTWPQSRSARALFRLADDAGMGRCERLLAQHLSAVRRRFGAYGVGLVDLPPLGPELLVPAQIRVSGVLYWCRELEHAGVLPLLEALGEALQSGALPIDDPAASRRLYRWWRNDSDRFTGPEREAVFARVFGPPGGEFSTAMSTLADALVELGRTRRDLQIAGPQARLAQAAIVVGRTLSDRGVGISAFAARDIVADIRAALGFLRDPSLTRVLGGGTPWRIITAWGPRLLGRHVRVGQHVQRAEAGLRIIEWIADNAMGLDAAARRVGRDHALVHAAESWKVVSRGV